MSTVAPLLSNWVAGIVYSESSGTIDGVTVVNMETIDFQPRTNGIWMSTGTSTASVEVKNCTVDNYNRGGIYAFGGMLTVNIHDNDVIGPGFATEAQVPNGIMLLNGVKGIVGPNNNVSNHMYPPLTWASTGIALWDVDGVTIEGNTVTDCELGIALTGYSGALNNIIRGNTVDGNPRAGIFLETPGTIDNIITGNTITNNGYGIEVFGPGPPSYDPGEEAGPGNVAHFNDIFDNTEYGVVNFNPAITFDATMNWWGDISGPEHEAPFGTYPANPGGTGNKVSDKVNYVPWLTRGFQTVLDDNIAYLGFPMVELGTGWNTFSTPIALDPGETIDGVTYPGCNTWGDYKALGDGLNVMEGVEGEVVNAYRYDAGADTPHFVALAGDYQLEPCDAIYVRMAEPDIAAILFSPEPSAPTKEVYQGWNLIGLAWIPNAPGMPPMIPVKEALISLYTVPGDYTGYSVVVSPPFHQQSWTFFRDGSDPPLMYPTWGYWVFMENGPDTLAGSTFTPMSLSGAPAPPPPLPG